jgi:hypothetical protein
MTDPAERLQALDRELERKANWTRVLGQRAGAHGEFSQEAYDRAKVDAGIDPEPPPAEPIEPEHATPAGDGGAIEHGSPPPISALDQRIADAESSGDHDLAIHLKNQLLMEINKRREGQ